MTAYDVAASWKHIVDPPEGVISVRRGYYAMIDKVEAPDAKTVVFHLKFATAAFLPALADPYAFIYKKDILDRDPHWFEKNIMGSGPFRFKDYQAGQSISGVRNPDYYRPGLPYLDGFIGIFADKQAVRVAAIKSDRAAIEFRGFPPATRDELVAALGDKITVQESDWNCGALVTPNHARKPFDDVRVRRALTLAIDRWHGAAPMSRITLQRTVGGIVFPGSPLCRQQAGTGAACRLLAGHREVARRGEAAAEGGRGRRADLRITQSQCRSALQVQWGLGHRRMEQDRRACDPARVADGAVRGCAAPGRFRGGDRRRVPEHRQSAARRHQVFAALGLRWELRQL